jgi:hypothetical protein
MSCGKMRTVANELVLQSTNRVRRFYEESENESDYSLALIINVTKVCLTII